MAYWSVVEFDRLYVAEENNYDTSQMATWQPEIDLENELPFNFNDDNLKNIFQMPTLQNIFHHLRDIHCCRGWSGVFEEIQSPEILDKYPKVQILINVINKIINVINSIKALFSFLPMPKFYTEYEVAEYAETKNWFQKIKLAIRFICWHPDNNQIALVCSDDCIRIYSARLLEAIILKKSLQCWVSCIAWRTCTTSELIVGCKSGLCHWLPNEFKKFHMNYYKQPDHSPITSLQWNSDGTFLITASINDRNILIWNICEGIITVLQRVHPSAHLIRYSPDESLLFGATIGRKFIVWDISKKWKCENWNTVAGHVQSVCWSPCSSFVLFITTEESKLYALANVKKQPRIKQNSIMHKPESIVDLAKLKYGNKLIGGKKPLALSWDDKGNNLAVIFKDINDVIVFNTKITNLTLNLTPNCIIQGSEIVQPTCIAFRAINHNNKNIILSISWSTGRLQYLNFYK